MNLTMILMMTMMTASALPTIREGVLPSSAAASGGPSAVSLLCVESWCPGPGPGLGLGTGSLVV